jgi:hypothetical protein
MFTEHQNSGGKRRKQGICARGTKKRRLAEYKTPLRWSQAEVTMPSIHLQYIEGFEQAEPRQL